MARVKDGDTLKLAGGTVRLGGMDAPESRQLCQRDGLPWQCSAEARATLERLVAGRRVRCELEPHRDRSRRFVGVCRVGVLDLGSEMVRLGWALDYPHYSKGRYAPQQAEAK